MFEGLRKRISDKIDVHMNSTTVQLRTVVINYERAYKAALDNPTPENVDAMAQLAEAAGTIMFSQLQEVIESSPYPGKRTRSTK